MLKEQIGDSLHEVRRALEDIKKALDTGARPTSQLASSITRLRHIEEKVKGY